MWDLVMNGGQCVSPLWCTLEICAGFNLFRVQHRTKQKTESNVKDEELKAQSNHLKLKQNIFNKM